MSIVQLSKVQISSVVQLSFYTLAMVTPLSRSKSSVINKVSLLVTLSRVSIFSSTIHPMTILLVFIVTICLGFCIPFEHEEEAEKAPMDDRRAAQSIILQWSKSRSINDVEYYDVPFTSLDRFIHLAKVMEKEFTLLHYNQANSSHLSEKIRLGVMNMNLSYAFASEQIDLLSDFQEDNAEELAKINRGVWFSTAMDCYRFKWMGQLAAARARFQRKRLFHVFKTEWRPREEEKGAVSCG